MSAAENVPKAVLYYDPKSVWSNAGTSPAFYTTHRWFTGAPSPNSHVRSILNRMKFVRHASYSEEKGYGADELDLKIVDLCMSCQLSFVVLRTQPHGMVCSRGRELLLRVPQVEPKGCAHRTQCSQHLMPLTGTVPTMVVPMQNTLSADTESRYKAVTDVEVSLLLSGLVQFELNSAHIGHHHAPRQVALRHLTHSYNV